MIQTCSVLSFPRYPGNDQWATAETPPPGGEQHFYDPDDEFDFLGSDERRSSNNKTNRRQTSRRGQGKREGDEEFDNV